MNITFLKIMVIIHYASCFCMSGASCSSNIRRLMAVKCLYSACPLGFNRDHFSSVSQDFLPFRPSLTQAVGFVLITLVSKCSAEEWSPKSVLNSSPWPGCSFRRIASRGGPNRPSHYVLRFQWTFPRLYLLQISVSIGNIEQLFTNYYLHN